MKLVDVKFVFIFIVFSGLQSCNEKVAVLDYCKILTDDQLDVNWDKSDMAKFEADKIKRSNRITNNFELLIRETKENGFPVVSLNFADDENCKSRAVTMTMIHIAQINPKLFFSGYYSKLFKLEIDKGNLDKELLKRSCIIAFKTEEICENLKSNIEDAINLWKLELSIMRDTKFVKC